MHCYLLVGGRSSRMGRSKLDVEIGGATFLSRVIAAARAVFDDVRAVQRPGGPVIDAIPTIFEAPHDHDGPIFGVFAALRDMPGEAGRLAIAGETPALRTAGRLAVAGETPALRTARRRCFVLAVDYPLIDVGLLRFLRERAEASRAPLLVPRWDGKLQMLCAAWSPELRPLVAARIAGGRFDMRALAAEAEIVEEEELRTRFSGEPLLNVNTPEELEKAAKLV